MRYHSGPFSRRSLLCLQLPFACSSGSWLWPILITMVCLLLETPSAQVNEDMLCADGEKMRICVPPMYMKFELPEEGEATNVSIGVDIKDIPKVR